MRAGCGPDGPPLRENGGERGVSRARRPDAAPPLATGPGLSARYVSIPSSREPGLVARSGSRATGPCRRSRNEARLSQVLEEAKIFRVGAVKLRAAFARTSSAPDGALTAMENKFLLARHLPLSESITLPDLKPLDAIDKKILALVQVDATLAIGEIAHRVGLSQTPCWKRLQRLEQTGVIKRRVALLDQAKLGLGLTVFVSIEVGEHSAAMQDTFATDVRAMPEVMDFYRMAGDVDYLLRVVVRDTAAFDVFYRRLVALAPLKSVKSRFALEGLKAETAMPIG